MDPTTPSHPVVMLDAEHQGRIIVDQDQALMSEALLPMNQNQPTCPWEEHFGAADDGDHHYPPGTGISAASRTLQARSTNIDPRLMPVVTSDQVRGSDGEIVIPPSTPMNIDIPASPQGPPTDHGPPGINLGSVVVGEFERDKLDLIKLGLHQRR